MKKTRAIAKSEQLKGKITPLEVQAFKRRTKVGSVLRCYRPRGREDKQQLEKMIVTALYPHVIVLSYQGAYRKMYETSMTWEEAIQLNRMTQEELTREIKQMCKEIGFTLSKKHRKAPPKNHYARRNKNASIIAAYREMGMTYAQIAAAVGCSTSTARYVYLKEVQGV